MLIIAMSIYSPKVVYAALGDIQSGLEDELFQLTNNARIENGLPPLILDTRLRDVARDRSSDMVKRNYFGHYAPPDNHVYFNMMDSAGISSLTNGENLEWNTAPISQTAQYAINEFMGSAGHRENLLNPFYTHMAMGAVQGPLRSGSTSYYFTQLFIRKTTSTCGASCIYPQQDADGVTRCYSGNCTDGSQNCSFNTNCSYVSGCSSGAQVACP